MADGEKIENTSKVSTEKPTPPPKPIITLNQPLYENFSLNDKNQKKEKR